MDGSNTVVLKVGMDNPNSVTIHDGSIYVLDSHAKSRENGLEDIKGQLYHTSLGENEDWTVLNTTMKVYIVSRSSLFLKKILSR